MENEINADPNITHIIQWSDGCGYQNRNKVLSSALLSLSHKKPITITQKYLEKGHTYMEVDTPHQKIEVGIKKNGIVKVTKHRKNCECCPMSLLIVR